MASITKNKETGNWEVRVRKAGFPTLCQNFPKKGDAQDWGQIQETAMKLGTWTDPRVRLVCEIVTLKDAIQKYAKEVSPFQKGHKQQLVRLKKWESHKIAKLPIRQVDSQFLHEHIEARKKEGRASNTIRLEMTLLSRVFVSAAKKFGVKGLANPVREIEMPAGSSKRSRRVSDKEFKAILKELRKECRNEHIPLVVEFAMYTCMRQSEIIGKGAVGELPPTLGLTWENIDFKKKTAFLPDTKSPTGKEKSRTVPLFDPAIEILKSLHRPRAHGKIFHVTQDGLIRAFAAARERAEIEDLHFHDLRHEGTSRLILNGYGIHEVMAIGGWSSVEIMNIYANLKADEILKNKERIPFKTRII